MPRPSPKSTQSSTSMSASAMKFAAPPIWFWMSAAANGLNWPSTTACSPRWWSSWPTRLSMNAATSRARAVTSAFCCWVK